MALTKIYLEILKFLSITDFFIHKSFKITKVETKTYILTIKMDWNVKNLARTLANMFFLKD